MAKTSKFLDIEDIEAILTPIKKKKSENLSETQGWVAFSEKISGIL